ncbi:hypothetical protein ABIA06_002039 [Bradyrhizobium yuanmingense]
MRGVRGAADRALCEGVARHCEEQSDEAIQTATAEGFLDCFASLAMTERLGITYPDIVALIVATGSSRASAFLQRQPQTDGTVDRPDHLALPLHHRRMAAQ